MPCTYKINFFVYVDCSLLFVTLFVSTTVAHSLLFTNLYNYYYYFKASFEAKMQGTVVQYPQLGSILERVCIGRKPMLVALSL
jgi:hypothetical protein